MKSIRNTLIVLMMLLGLAYFAQAQKAVRVKKVRLMLQKKDGAISQDEYDSEIQGNSLGKMLMSPKDVLEVDLF